MDDLIKKGAELLLRSRSTVAFTGAGISVESGIPPFRGKDGLWARYDPVFIKISYFYENPKESWEKINEVFYGFIGSAHPNRAHTVLAAFESEKKCDSVITQNIDGLHQKAGTKNVHEFHGTTSTISCTECKRRYFAHEVNLSTLPPLCADCGSLLKPDFVFFGEQIDAGVIDRSTEAAENASLMLVVGTTGEVMPACNLPYKAKHNSAYIIEINPEPSVYTDSISDIFIQMKAGEALDLLAQAAGIKVL